MSTITTTSKLTLTPHPVFSANENTGHNPAPADGEKLPLHAPFPPDGRSLMASGFLDDLLNPDFTPTRICQLHDISLAQLRNITESAEFKQAIADSAAINNARRETIRDQLYTQALAAASDLIREAAHVSELNRTCTTEPRPQAPTNPEAHRRALVAATRHHAANARLLETRRKAINTVLRECRPEQGERGKLKPKRPHRNADAARSNKKPAQIKRDSLQFHRGAQPPIDTPACPTSDNMIHKRRNDMNRDQLEGNWKQFKGKAKEKWGKLTDDDLDTVNGRAEQLEGKIQERYGKTKEQARDEVNQFCKSCKC